MSVKVYFSKLFSGPAFLSFALPIAAFLGGCGPEALAPNTAANTGPTAAQTPLSSAGSLSGVGAERINIAADGTITSMAAAQNCRVRSDDRRLNAALKSGNARGLQSEKSLVKFLHMSLDCADETRAAIHSAIFTPQGREALGPITWDPTHDAAILTAQPGAGQIVLRSNTVAVNGYTVRNEPLAVAGTARGSRHLALASNPMRTKYRGFAHSDAMDQFLKNSIAWMTGREEFSARPLNIVIAQTSQSYYFPDQRANRAWLDANYSNQVSYNAAQSCDNAALAGCLAAGPDLLIISPYVNAATDVEAVVSAVKTGMAQGVPVLYQHYDGGQTALSDALLPMLGAGFSADNYWRKQSLLAAQPELEMGATQTLRDLITRLDQDTFSIDFAQCDDKSCEESSGFAPQFSTPVGEIRARFNAMDKSGVDLFTQEGREIDKALVLLADRYRQQARYPMDKLTTSPRTFLRALYSDMVSPVVRRAATLPADMGNHSRTDFSHIVPATKSVEMETASRGYRSSGVYALPGQTVTVTRTDDLDQRTFVRVNLIRDGATHLFNTNGYTRPRHTRSSEVQIAAGQTVQITSAFGGPILVWSETKDQVVSFDFENIGQHAVWRSAADDAAFTQALDAGDYDWAEILTPSFEVHSTLERMRQTVQNEIFPSAASVASATQTQLHNYPHALAGFKGAGITPIPEIEDFAAQNGLEIHTLETVKHMNADQATCGYGCSGNPYDAYWAYNPLGHGDLHELGHGLERGRFRFEGQVGHTTTNPYSYYSKWRYFQETADPRVEAGCQRLPYADLFNSLQASINEAEPRAYMAAQDLTAWNKGAAINYQIKMGAQAMGLLTDGHHMIGRLHVIDREFNLAENSDDAWAQKKDGLGFGAFTREQARALSNNDWNLIARSHAIGRDLSDYIEMWGYTLSDGAKDAVAARGFPKFPLEYYAAGDRDHCMGLTAETIALDGKAAWPHVSQHARSAESSAPIFHHEEE